MARTTVDIEALYASHSEPLLLFLARRTADPQVALDLWAERRALDRLKLERPPADPGLLAEIERRAGLVALRAELAAALAELSPAVRDAVRMRVVDELPYPDVAQRLGISEQAARARVSRGLSALAGLLDTPTIHEAVTT